MAKNLTTSTANSVSGTVTTPGIGVYPYGDGTTQSILATANNGYQFTGWTGTAVVAGKVADVKDPDSTVVMTNDYTLIANFNLIQDPIVKDDPNQPWRIDPKFSRTRVSGRLR